LFFIADRSPTARLLREAAGRLGLEVVEEAELACPALDLVGQAEHARACTRKKSLRRHEQYFRREGRLEVQHFRQSEEILPHLNDFFEQHVTRRAATNHPSLFSDPRQRDYYRRLTCAIGSTGWLRFTRVLWNGRPIAFHYGLSYRGRFLFGIPAFAIDLARHSPGEVLLRQLLLLAIEEGATTFDFGPGDEAYKYRFATHVTYLRTWGLYPC
jgi:CelD/BcsL family acetyltransferase involved in cellulose biosynthesis